MFALDSFYKSMNDWGVDLASILYAHVPPPYLLKVALCIKTDISTKNVVRLFVSHIRKRFVDPRLKKSTLLHFSDGVK